MNRILILDDDRAVLNCFQTLLAQTTPCAQYQQQRQCQPAGISRGRQRLGSGGLASPQQQCNKQTAERFHRSIPEFASDSQV